MTRALVIGRRRKGRPIARVVRETQARLQDAGWEVTAEVVARKRALRRHTASAVADGVDVVVAVGGDGAVLQVVQKLAQTDVALAIVPMGTGNLLAGNLGIPKDAEKAAAVAIAAVTVPAGRRRRIDLGRMTAGGKKRYFAVACGVGFDAKVMDRTAKSTKLRFGKLAYLASAFLERGQVRNVEHRILLDGEERTLQATQVFVANFGRMGPGVEPHLEVSPDDGLLDLIVVSASGPIEGLLAGWDAIWQGRSGRAQGGRAYRARAKEVGIKTDVRRLVETDGSVVGKTPVDVTVHPAALTVLVPEKE